MLNTGVQQNKNKRKYTENINYIWIEYKRYGGTGKDIYVLVDWNRRCRPFNCISYHSNKYDLDGTNVS